MPRHVDCSQAEAAGPCAASRDAIGRRVTTWEVLGKDARPSPADPAHLPRPHAEFAVRCVCGANALTARAPHEVVRAAYTAAPAVVRIRLNVHARAVARSKRPGAHALPGAVTRLIRRAGRDARTELAVRARLRAARACERRVLVDTLTTVVWHAVAIGVVATRTSIGGRGQHLPHARRAPGRAGLVGGQDARARARLAGPSVVAGTRAGGAGGTDAGRVSWLSGRPLQSLSSVDVQSRAFAVTAPVQVVGHVALTQVWVPGLQIPIAAGPHARVVPLTHVQPSWRMPLQLSSLVASQPSAGAGPTEPLHAPQALDFLSAATTQVCDPALHGPLPS